MRNSRAMAILDEDDLNLLYILRSRNSISTKNIIKKLKISHKGYLTHKKRMERYNLIVSIRNWRNKSIQLTCKGKKLLNIFTSLKKNKSGGKA